MASGRGDAIEGLEAAIGDAIIEELEVTFGDALIEELEAATIASIKEP